MKMRNEYLVTVIVLLYNKAAYVTEALNSIVRQECDFKYKILIVDDCSTDQSPDICRKFQTEYPDIIRIVSNEKNLGVVLNFEKAYNLCDTPYIAICDPDDFYISKHKLQRQVDYLDTHPECSVVFHRALNYYENTGIKTLSNPNQKRILTLADMATSNFITNSTCMFRKLYPEGLPEWYKDVSTNDLPMHLLNALHGDIHYQPQIMTVYRKEYGESNWAGEDPVKRLFLTLNSRYPLLNDPSWPESIRKAMKLQCLQILILIQRQINNPNEELYHKASQMSQSLNLNDIEIAEVTKKINKRNSVEPGILKIIASKSFRLVSRLVPISVFRT